MRTPRPALVGSLLLTLAVTAARADLPVDNFDDGASCGWQQVGDSHFIASYAVRIVAPGHESPYALRVQMNELQGWCGVATPDLSRLNLRGATAVRFFARNAGDCGRLLVDFHQKDRTRWWRKVDLPADGAWIEVVNDPASFFRVEGTGDAKTPDLTQWGALWLSLDDARKPGAAVDIDTMTIVDAKPLETAVALTRAMTPKPQRVTGNPLVLIQETPGAPFAGAMRDALTAAGARVETVKASDLTRRITGKTPPDVLVVGGGPLPDQAALRQYLAAGKALWYQATPAMAPPALTDMLLNAPVYGRHWVELDPMKLTLTDAGRAVWPHLPAELPATKCSFVLPDDTNWSYVSVQPLLTCRFPQRNWVSLMDSFTGSVGVLLSHHAGPWAGSRILMIGQGGDPQSPFSPASPLWQETAQRSLSALLKSVPRWNAPVATHLPDADRKRLLTRDGPLMATIEFSQLPRDDDEYFALHRQVGFNAALLGVPWLGQPDKNGDVIDWTYTDWVMVEAKKHGIRIVFDPYNFFWWYGAYAWAGKAVNEKGEITDSPDILDPASQRFIEAMRRLVARYRDDPTLCAVMATPHTGTFQPKADASPAGRAAWVAYLKARGFDLPAVSKRYGRPVDSWEKAPLPDLGPGDGLDCSSLRADYYDFYTQTYYAFMDATIRGIRAEVPDMPILLRGGWWEVATSFELARRYPRVAPHCECVETSTGVDAFFRGFSMNFGVPASGENGWPRERGGPLRMAMSDILMGGYTDFLYSFGGPRPARPSAYDFATFTRIWPTVVKAEPLPAKLGVLISDTTLFASRPPGFMAMQGRPHLEDVMERLDHPFQCVSAHWPRLEGLSVILDDGVNEALTPATRDKLIDWVRKGGTLIGTPMTGRLMFGDNGPSLWEAIGVTPDAGQAQEFPVGKGRAVILPKVPQLADAPSVDSLDALLTRLLGQPLVRVSPRVNHCVREVGGRLYVIAYNKLDEHIGAFFQESRLPAVERSLPNLALTIGVQSGIASARELVTGAKLESTGGAVRCALPATTYRVIEIATGRSGR